MYYYLLYTSRTGCIEKVSSLIKDTVIMVRIFGVVIQSCFDKHHSSKDLSFVFHQL
jgi:hypothetical protein